jgi:hypothetical protein
MVLEVDLTSGVVDRYAESSFESELSHSYVADETGVKIGSLLDPTIWNRPPIALIFGVPKTSKSFFLVIWHHLIDLSALLAVSTATPRPTPIPDSELAGACAGTPTPAAAPYGGTVHPLVVIETNGGISQYAYAINNKWFLLRDMNSPGDSDWYSQPWPSPIQLVLCAGDEQAAEDGSCGQYQQEGTGQVGEVVRYRYAKTVQVIVALTGKLLVSKVFYGSSVSCDSGWHSEDVNPPWRIYGGHVDSGAINTYATSVATQAVK